MENGASQTDDFLKKLQQEAKHQSRLEKVRLLPKNIDWLAQIIATHPWQILLLVSFFTTLVIEIIAA
jgi:hypothetical protein